MLIPEAVRVSRCVTILISVDNVNVAGYFTKPLLNTLPSSASFYYFIRTWSLQGLTRTTESVKEERDYGWWSLYRLKHFGGLTILLFLLVHVFLTSDRSNSCQQWSQHSDYAEQWPVLLVKTILDIKVGVNVIQCDFLPSVYHLDYVHGRLRLQK